MLVIIFLNDYKVEIIDYVVVKVKEFVKVEEMDELKFKLVLGFVGVMVVINEFVLVV